VSASLRALIAELRALLVLLATDRHGHPWAYVESRAGSMVHVQPMIDRLESLAGVETDPREILPCPCGNEFVECFGTDSGGWWVGCKPCGRNGSDYAHAKTRTAAIAHWNTKLASPPTPKEPTR